MDDLDLAELEKEIMQMDDTAQKKDNSPPPPIGKKRSSNARRIDGRNKHFSRGNPEA